MNRTLFYIAINVLSLLSAYGQKQQPYGSLGNNLSVRDELGIAMKNGVQNAYTMPRKYEGIQGDPFYDNRWSSGVVCLVKDSAIVNQSQTKFKFDSYTNELWILQGRDSMIAYSRDIHWFMLDNEAKQVTFLKFPQQSNGSPHKFFRVLYNGHMVKLAQEVKKELRRADFIDKGMYSSGSPFDRFEEKSVYVLAVGKDLFRKTKLTLNDLTDGMTVPLRKKVKLYAKEQKIKGKLSEEEAIRLLMYADKN